MLPWSSGLVASGGALAFQFSPVPVPAVGISLLLLAYRLNTNPVLVPKCSHPATCMSVKFSSVFQHSVLTLWICQDVATGPSPGVRLSVMYRVVVNKFILSQIYALLLVTIISN